MGFLEHFQHHNQTLENIFQSIFWNATKHLKIFSFPENIFTWKYFTLNQTQPKFHNIFQPSPSWTLDLAILKLLNEPTVLHQFGIRVFAKRHILLNNTNWLEGKIKQNMKLVKIAISASQMKNKQNLGIKEKWSYVF